MSCCTRPDVCYAVNKLAKYSNNPGIKHYKALLHLIGYLKGNNTKGLAFYTDTKFCHISAVNSILKKKGYNLNELQKPDAVHLAVTENHTSEEFKKQFIIDVIVAVRESISSQKQALNRGEEVGAAIYGTSQKINDSSIIDTVARNYLDLLYC